MGVAQSIPSTVDRSSLALGTSLTAALEAAHDRVAGSNGLVSTITFVRYVLGVACPDMPMPFARALAQALLDVADPPISAAAAARDAEKAIVRKFSKVAFIRAIAILVRGTPRALARVAFLAIARIDGGGAEAGITLTTLSRRIRVFGGRVATAAAEAAAATFAADFDAGDDDLAASPASPVGGATLIPFFAVAAHTLRAVLETAASQSLGTASAARARDAASLIASAPVRNPFLNAQALAVTLEEWLAWAEAKAAGSDINLTSLEARASAADGGGSDLWLPPSSCPEQTPSPMPLFSSAAPGWATEPTLAWLLQVGDAVARVCERAVARETVEGASARAAIAAAAALDADAAAPLRAAPCALSAAERAALTLACAAAAAAGESGLLDAAALAALLNPRHVPRALAWDLFAAADVACAGALGNAFALEPMVAVLLHSQKHTPMACTQVLPTAVSRAALRAAAAAASASPPGSRSAAGLPTPDKNLIKVAASSDVGDIGDNDDAVDVAATTVGILLETALLIDVGLPAMHDVQATVLGRVWHDYSPSTSRAGDVWFVVPAPWFTAWARWAGWGGGVRAAVAFAAAAGVRPPRFAPPGAIPTASLLAVNTGAPMTGTPPPAELRANLIPGTDFALIAPRAWRALRAWHGIAGPPLPRAVIDTRLLPHGSLIDPAPVPDAAWHHIELYPLALRLERVPGAPPLTRRFALPSAAAAALALGPAAAHQGARDALVLPWVLRGVDDETLNADSESESEGDTPEGTNKSPSSNVSSKAKNLPVVLISRSSRAGTLRDAVAAALGLRATRIRLWRRVRAADRREAALVWSREAPPAAVLKAVTALEAWPYLPLAGPADAHARSAGGGARWEWAASKSHIAWGGGQPQNSGGRGGNWGRAGFWSPPHLHASGAPRVCIDVASLSGKWDILAESAVPISNAIAIAGGEKTKLLPEGVVTSHIAIAWDAVRAVQRGAGMSFGGGKVGVVRGAATATAAAARAAATAAAGTTSGAAMVGLPPPPPNTPHLGLVNLGQSCYVSAPLQAVLALPFLSAYFSSGAWARDAGGARARAGGSVAGAFALTALGALRAAPQPGDEIATLAPAALRVALDAAAGLASDEQHDAEEALSLLLARLSEELNVAPAPAKGASMPAAHTPRPPPVSGSNDDGDDDIRAAADAWHTGEMVERSFVRSLTTGQLRSRVVCQHCQAAAASFEPFGVLPLPMPPPLPQKKQAPFIIQPPAGDARRPTAAAAPPAPATLAQVQAIAAAASGGCAPEDYVFFRVLGALPLDGGGGGAPRIPRDGAALADALAGGSVASGVVTAAVAMPRAGKESAANAVLFVSHSGRARAGSRRTPGVSRATAAREMRARAAGWWHSVEDGESSGGDGGGGATATTSASASASISFSASDSDADSDSSHTMGKSAICALEAWASPPPTAIPAIVFGPRDAYLLTPHARSPLPAPPVLARVSPSELTARGVYALVAASAKRWLRRAPVSSTSQPPAPHHRVPQHFQVPQRACEIRAVWGFVLRRAERSEGGWAGGCPDCEWPAGCRGCVLAPLDVPLIEAVPHACRNARAGLAAEIAAFGSKGIEAEVNAPWLSFIAEWDDGVVQGAWDGAEAVSIDLATASPVKDVAVVTLDDCLEFFARPQALDEPRECNMCCQRGAGVQQSAGETPIEIDTASALAETPLLPLLRQPATVRLELFALPPVLILQLKRFAFGDHARKTNARVRLLGTRAASPLCLRAHLAKTAGTESASASASPFLSRSETHYVLYGLVNHFGSLGAGHYTAVVRAPGGVSTPDAWLSCNDHIVTRATRAQIRAPPAAYLLFYVRADVHAAWVQAGGGGGGARSPGSADASAAQRLPCGCPVPRAAPAFLAGAFDAAALWPTAHNPVAAGAALTALAAGLAAEPSDSVQKVRAAVDSSTAAISNIFGALAGGHPHVAGAVAAAAARVTALDAADAMRARCDIA